jgi:hypothetical protein
MPPVRWSRFDVAQLGPLGPWQVRESLPERRPRIVATCPDQEVADAIAKFLNGDAEGAYRDLRFFHAVGEADDP